MRTIVTKRSVVIGGRKTSISLEDEFWQGLKAIAQRQQCTLSALVGEIDRNRHGNLSSAIRVFVFGHLCRQPPAEAPGDTSIVASSSDRHASRAL